MVITFQIRSMEGLVRLNDEIHAVFEINELEKADS